MPMKILIAKDEAFSFMYRANIDALASMGHIAYFSPLSDTELLECDLLYLPGGYPELYADRLADNEAIRSAIRDYAVNGGRVLAECGGFMYLCNDMDGVPMCGMLPMSATMQGARLHLGYRQMSCGGVILRGHEFHYSKVIEAALPADVRCIKKQLSAIGKPVDTALYRYKNVVAGYTHWYWAETSIDELWKL